MRLRIFITGAGGYLGSVLVKQLVVLPEIDHITGIVYNNLPRDSFPDKVNLVKMDIRSPEIVDAMAEHDFVIHTAFIVQWSASMPVAVRDDICLNGTRNVAEAAVKNRVRGFIHASSLAAYDPFRGHGKENLDEEFPIGEGNSQMYYWNNKAKTERILSEVLAGSDMTLTLLRLPYIIGPCNRATVPGFRQNAVLFPGHDPRTQFIHEDDVARAFAQAIRNPMPGAFNVVPDDSIRLSEAYRFMGAKPITLPVWLAKWIAYVRWRFLGSPTHPSWVQATLVDFSAINAKLRATGWEPHYNCTQAIYTALESNI